MAVFAAAAAVVFVVFCMEGHSSGTIDCKQAGAHRDVILECPDWICKNLQVGRWFLASFKYIFCVSFRS